MSRSGSGWSHNIDLMWLSSLIMNTSTATIAEIWFTPFNERMSERLRYHSRVVSLSLPAWLFIASTAAVAATAAHVSTDSPAAAAVRVPVSAPIMVTSDPVKWSSVTHLYLQFHLPASPAIFSSNHDEQRHEAIQRTTLDALYDMNHKCSQHASVVNAYATLLPQCRVLPMDQQPPTVVPECVIPAIPSLQSVITRLYVTDNDNDITEATAAALGYVN
jgi:hypothetical protein